QGRANWVSTLDPTVYTEKMLGLADRFVSAGRKIKVVNISTLLKNIISPRRDYMCLRFPCGAGISMLGVGVNGEVYSCEEMNGKEELQIGNVYNNSIEEIFNHPTNQRIKCRTLEKMTECRDCFAVDACGINCANRSHSETKDFYSKTPLCDYYKQMIPGLIWRIYENPKIIKCLT
ncbi:MAG: SPASM domain-containing protein, partial [Nanoarchaeota archaeon]|nr:SPASM domain-containing protein [Nanoarchaeota archaeon]